MKYLAALALFIISILPSFADMKSAAYDSAKKSDAALTDFRTQKISQIRQKKIQLDSKLTRIRELRKKVDSLNSAFDENSSLTSASSFYDARAVELAADMGGFAAEFARDCDCLKTPAKSLEECAAMVSLLCKDALNSLLNPTCPRNFRAKLVSSRSEIGGKIFRVGAFRYFISDSHAGLIDDSGVLYGLEYVNAIRDFADGKTDVLPADISNGAVLAAEKNSRTFAEEISLGGIWMYPILLLGFVSAAVFIVKLFFFIRIRRAPSGIVRMVKNALSEGDTRNALKICEKAGYPYSRLLSDLVRSRNLPQAMLEEVSYESMLGAGEKLFSWLSALSVSAAVAPLLGLLGTVTGIIKTFGDLSFAGAGQAQFISAGISEALITTEYGLVVAIPAYIAHAIFSRRAKSVLSDMEKIASSFLSGN